MSRTKSPITTHILDVQRGLPVAGVQVKLARLVDDDYAPMATDSTDADGRIINWTDLANEACGAGQYQVTFYTESYFQNLGETSLYPKVRIEFYLTDTQSHYHIPLLLSANGYTTYRGS